MLTTGATVSTVNAREAGDASTAPAASMARRRGVCAPWVSVAVVCGDAQALQALATVVSIAHWKVEPGSVDVNVNVGVVLLVGPLGPPVMLVFGGPLALTTKLRVA